MPKKNNPGCNCCTATICAPVKGCNGTALQGATVHIKDHSTGLDITGSPCTTDSTGQCCITATPGNSYDITASAPHFTSSTVSGYVPSAGTNTLSPITLSPDATSRCLPCSTQSIPNSLTLTHSGGTLTLVWNVFGFPNVYYGCATYPMSGAANDGGGCGGVSCASGSVNTPVAFVLTPCTSSLAWRLTEMGIGCASGSPPTFGGWTDTHKDGFGNLTPFVCGVAGIGQNGLQAFGATQWTAFCSPSSSSYGPLNLSFAMPTGTLCNSNPGLQGVVPFTGTITVTE